jgi:hypothetical protein
MEIFTQNIEQVILERFDKAKHSITIVVAWFTNPKLVAKLIELRKYKELDIQILVDKNEINQKYFFEPHASNLLSSGVQLKSQHISKFNHNKFAIIDNETVITGSYNFTIKANNNRENIVIENDPRIANYLHRVFNVFTDEKYVDPNIEILFEDFDFANKLISAYHPFSKRLFQKLKPKINLGFCFTHENGLYNEISYEPGLIFNPRFTLHTELVNIIKAKQTLENYNYELSQEFDLPITKELIRDFKANETHNFNYQIIREGTGYIDSKIDYEEFADLYEKNEEALTQYYTRKFATFYTTEELRSILKKGIDIIIEDYIWIHNFAPFLNNTIIENVYSNHT